MRLELEFRLEDFVLFEEYIGRSVLACRLSVDSIADSIVDFLECKVGIIFFGLGFYRGISLPLPLEN